MGYESRFYVVEKSSLQPDADGKRFANEFARFNLCKIGYDSHAMRLILKSPYTDSYVYEDDGNTKILKDKYDEPLKEIEIDKLILAIEDDYSEEDYRRYYPFIQFLKAIQEQIAKNKWDNIVILHFGY